MIKLQNIQSFIERLPKREKAILYIAVFFVSITLLDRLIISPIFNKIKFLDKEFTDKKKAIKRNMHILSQKDRILAERDKYASLLRSLESEEEQMTAILKEIENLANEASVYLVDMKPADVKNVADTKKYTITLNCEAQVEQLADFMYKIEDSNKLLRVERYQISPKTKDSSMAKCNMFIAKIVLSE
ncbi:MAG: hypothetical protein JW946_05025 [Candidatus Omnitrophica bacterium]|nr:hypothetical protein [Candidatus Omnitrophota bacterium]